MKISAKGRYSIIFMTDLASHINDGFISLNDISERNGISKKFLEQIVPVLNKSGLLKTNRGSKGGYALADSPDKISVGDILRLTENNLLEYDSDKYEEGEKVMTLFIWDGLNKVVADYLDNITLLDILERQSSYYVGDYVI